MKLTTIVLAGAFALSGTAAFAQSKAGATPTAGAPAAGTTTGSSAPKTGTTGMYNNSGAINGPSSPDPSGNSYINSQPSNGSKLRK